MKDDHNVLGQGCRRHIRYDPRAEAARSVSNCIRIQTYRAATYRPEDAPTAAVAEDMDSFDALLQTLLRCLNCRDYVGTGAVRRRSGASLAGSDVRCGDRGDSLRPAPSAAQEVIAVTGVRGVLEQAQPCGDRRRALRMLKLCKSLALYQRGWHSAGCVPI
jgi:hypothetical protein